VIEKCQINLSLFERAPRSDPNRIQVMTSCMQTKKIRGVRNHLVISCKPVNVNLPSYRKWNLRPNGFTARLQIVSSLLAAMRPARRSVTERAWFLGNSKPV